jgi:hypothetical protein
MKLMSSGLGFSDHPSESKLRAHARHHNIRKWLEDGAKREDAQTILSAIRRMPDDRLLRRFARMLCQK